MSENAMITIFTRRSNKSCREVIRFFKENNILYEERQISVEQVFTREELISIFQATDDIYKIISTRGRTYRESSIKFEELCIKSELIPYIQENPSFLKFPIILQGKAIQSGFNRNGLRVYLSREFRRKEMQRMLKQAI